MALAGIACGGYDQLRAELVVAGAAEANFGSTFGLLTSYRMIFVINPTAGLSTGVLNALTRFYNDGGILVSVGEGQGPPRAGNEDLNELANRIGSPLQIGTVTQGNGCGQVASVSEHPLTARVSALDYAAANIVTGGTLVATGSQPLIRTHDRHIVVADTNVLSDSCTQTISLGNRRFFGNLWTFFATRTCGDGVVSLGEACDGNGLGIGGETPTCDVDCTPVSCGDGIVNTSALEQCDGDGAGTGGETASCNIDCTPAQCGDGVVNAAALEQCDGNGAGFGGETAACNIDCSLSVCGDGVRNISAGEVCDGDGMGSGGDTVICDADCTPAICGDGFVNPVAGETCDGDGEGTGGETETCNAGCVATSCGNGFIEAMAGEQCDGDGLGNPGQTDVCDHDCTTALCGDGEINERAGEECDDRNAIDGDGCSSLCIYEDVSGCRASEPNTGACGALLAMLVLARLRRRRQSRAGRAPSAHGTKASPLGA